MLTVMERVVRTTYPVCAKRFLQLRGLPIGTTCRSGQLLDAHNDTLLKSLLETSEHLREKLS